jgi:hypothetical protein
MRFAPSLARYTRCLEKALQQTWAAAIHALHAQVPDSQREGTGGRRVLAPRPDLHVLLHGLATGLVDVLLDMHTTRRPVIPMPE